MTRLQTRGFWSVAGSTAVLMLVLVALEATPLPALLADSGTDLALVRRTVRRRGLNEEAREKETAGYYEGLLNNSAETSTAAPNVLAGLIRGRSDNRTALEGLDADMGALHERDGSFRLYTTKRNLDLADSRFPIRHVSNSMGFADREYSVERPPNVRRAIVLGDSVTRGFLVPIEQTFDALLEVELNRVHLTPQVRNFEFINMAQSGYRITQVLDLALEEGTRLQPDVYIVALTEVSIFGRWGLHVSQLFDEGQDLKYDYLRDLVRQADLKRDDSPATRRAKLGRFMIPTLQWALDEIRRTAEMRGASLVVALVPNLRNAGDLDYLFRPVRRMLRDERFLTVDLLDAFDNVDQSTVDSGDGIHPGAEGHRLIYQRFYQRIRSNPTLASALGVSVPPAPPRE